MQYKIGESEGRNISFLSCFFLFNLKSVTQNTAKLFKQVNLSDHSLKRKNKKTKTQMINWTV